MTSTPMMYQELALEAHTSTRMASNRSQSGSIEHGRDCHVGKLKCLPVNRDWQYGERCAECIVRALPCGAPLQDYGPQLMSVEEVNIKSADQALQTFVSRLLDRPAAKHFLQPSHAH